MNEADFGRLCGSLEAPMIVVTAAGRDERSGCLAGFHTQCSIHPRRWLVCISKLNHTLRVAEDAEWLVVHFLRADQHGLAELFGGTTADAMAPQAKFEACAWRPGPAGTPILLGCDWIAGRVVARSDVGDHVAHVIEIEEIGLEHGPARQLGPHDVGDVRPGHPS